MNTHTSSRQIPELANGEVLDRLDSINARLAKLGCEPATVEFSDRRKVVDPIMGRTSYWNVATVSYGTVALPGDWTLVGVAEFGSTDEPLIFNLVDDAPAFTDVPDAGRCDHCNTRRNRSAIFAVRNSDGEDVVVGRTCVADFLGVPVDGILRLAGPLAELDDLFEDVGSSRSTRIPVRIFVAAAASAVEHFGWRKSNHEDGSTKGDTLDILRPPSQYDSPELVEARDSMSDYDDAAAAAIEWASTLSAEPGTFEGNLAAVARSEFVDVKGYGIAAYLPVAHRRHIEDGVRRAAEAEVKAQAEPVPTAGRTEVVGKIISSKTYDNGYDVVTKITVLDDRGFRIFVSLPAAISEADLGDRVRFVAALSRSDDDPTFGFGKRPTKAEVLPAEAA